MMNVDYDALVAMLRRVVREELQNLNVKVGVQITPKQLRAMVVDEVVQLVKQKGRDEMSASELLKLLNNVEVAKKGKLNEPTGKVSENRVRVRVYNKDKVNIDGLK